MRRVTCWFTLFWLSAVHPRTLLMNLNVPSVLLGLGGKCLLIWTLIWNFLGVFTISQQWHSPSSPSTAMAPGGSWVWGWTDTTFVYWFKSWVGWRGSLPHRHSEHESFLGQGAVPCLPTGGGSPLVPGHFLSFFCGLTSSPSWRTRRPTRSASAGWPQPHRFWTSLCFSSWHWASLRLILCTW